MVHTDAESEHPLNLSIIHRIIKQRISSIFEVYHSQSRKLVQKFFDKRSKKDAIIQLIEEVLMINNAYHYQ